MAFLLAESRMNYLPTILLGQDYFHPYFKDGKTNSLKEVKLFSGGSQDSNSNSSILEPKLLLPLHTVFPYRHEVGEGSRVFWSGRALPKNK